MSGVIWPNRFDNTSTGGKINASFRSFIGLVLFSFREPNAVGGVSVVFCSAELLVSQNVRQIVKKRYAFQKKVRVPLVWWALGDRGWRRRFSKLFLSVPGV